MQPSNQNLDRVQRVMAQIEEQWLREPIEQFCAMNRATIALGNLELDKALADDRRRLRVSITALQRTAQLQLAACELRVQSKLLIIRDADRLLGDQSPWKNPETPYWRQASEERFLELLNKLQPRTTTRRNNPRPACERRASGESKSSNTPSPACERRASGERTSNNEPETPKEQKPENRNPVHERRASGERTSNNEPETPKELPPQNTETDNTLAVQIAWENELNEWNEGRRKDPPTYPRELIELVRREAAGNPEHVAFTRNFEAQLRQAGMHPDQQSPEVSAPTAG